MGLDWNQDAGTRTTSSVALFSGTPAALPGSPWSRGYIVTPIRDVAKLIILFL